MNEAKEALISRLAKLDAELQHSYEGRAGAVSAAINECRNLLRNPDGELGPWEAADLDYAETAVGANFLRLALACVAKAVHVSCLPPEEYERGYNYQGYRRVSE